jgi:hypothetical protein
VAATVEVLHASRSKFLVESGLGLTSTYNRFHDPSDMSPGIVELRRLHVELDTAVRDAYGWSDLDLQHGFYPVRGQGVRFTFAPEVANEILERLLELNKERFEAEAVSGKAVASTSAKSGRVGDLSLFEDDVEDEFEMEDDE